MTRTVPLLPSLMFTLALATAPAWAQHSHVHGQARLDVAIDGPLLTLSFESPLDSLVGFEHRPRTAAQKQAAEAAINRLRDAAALWGADAAAQCSATETTLDVDALQPSATPAAAVATEHAEASARYAFRCAAPDQLKVLTHSLFEAFPRLQRLDVQVAGPRGQVKQALRRPAKAVRLVR